MFDHFETLTHFFGDDFEYGVDNHAGAVFTVKGIPQSCKFLRCKNKECCIYLRPLAARAPYFLLIDDVDAIAAGAHRTKPGRLVVETSPANFQVWVHFDSPLSVSQKKILMLAAGGDPAAHPNEARWGRCPGYVNRKLHPKKLGKNGERFWSRLSAVTEGETAVESLAGLLSAGPEIKDVSLPGCNASRQKVISLSRDESAAEYRAAAEMLRKGRMTKSQIIQNIARHAFSRSKRRTFEDANTYAIKLVESIESSISFPAYTFSTLSSESP